MKFLYLLRAMVFFALAGAVILNSAEAVVALLIVAVALSAISLRSVEIYGKLPYSSWHTYSRRPVRFGFRLFVRRPR